MTHLMRCSNIFYSASSIMRTAHAGVRPNVDLHHALLGGINGGGIAYIGVVCRSDYGFGLTSGLSGTFQSMGDAVLWDMKAFMHEVSASYRPSHVLRPIVLILPNCFLDRTQFRK